MELEQTSMYLDVRSIIENGATNSNYTWKVEIHYTEGRTYVPLQVLEVSVVRDYVNSFADVTIVKTQIPLGDYARLIHPNRVGLKINLIKIPLEESTDSTDDQKSDETELYPAVLLDLDKSPTIGQGMEVLSTEALNLQQILTVSFQLYDHSVEQMRVKTVSANFRRATIENAIKALLTKEASLTNVSEQRSIVGVEMVPADNVDLIEQISVTYGMRIFDVPGYLQSTYGVYNADLGIYLQDRHWFIYPLYNTNQFEERAKTLTMYVVPAKKFTQIERTYKLDVDALSVIVSGQTGFKDDSGTKYINSGNGARFAIADNLMNSPVQGGGNKARFSRKSNNSVFKADDSVSVNNVATNRRRITSNAFVVYSELAAKNGGIFRGVWQNSDPSLIYPGMVAKVVYADGAEIRELYGVVHAVRTVSVKSIGFNQRRFRTQSVVDLFVNGQVTAIEA